MQGLRGTVAALQVRQGQGGTEGIGKASISIDWARVVAQVRAVRGVTASRLARLVHGPDTAEVLADCERPLLNAAIRDWDRKVCIEFLQLRAVEDAGKFNICSDTMGELTRAFAEEVMEATCSTLNAPIWFWLGICKAMEDLLKAKGLSV